MTLRTGSVNTSTVGGLDSFLMATLATQQSTNIAANDHIKFDTVNVGFGSEVTLDTSTAYSNTTGAASIGRFTLHGTPNGGLTYKLSFNVGYVLFSGATGLLTLQFFDATNNVAIPGGTVTVVAATDATADGGSSSAEAVFEPLADTLVEVRIITATALTRIGTTGTQFPSIFVQTL